MAGYDSRSLGFSWFDERLRKLKFGVFLVRRPVTKVGVWGFLGSTGGVLFCCLEFPAMVRDLCEERRATRSGLWPDCGRSPILLRLTHPDTAGRSWLCVVSLLCNRNRSAHLL
ncbi:hypothetical protein V6N12_058972 [Hibiscus sabdariffa]|uniref:Uncharacterized protein n=1 Tax=Hibiscus sabdariffa TaxID=183260 RepID=A0ABR2ETS3_9ROSI